MSKFQLVKWSFIVLTLIFQGHFQAISQTPENINSLIDNLLKKDFKEIKVNQADTVLTNQLLIKVKKCTENRNDSALFYGFQTIITAEKAGLVSVISLALEDLGKDYMTRENFSEAINSYIQALKLEEKQGNKSRIADMYDLLGIVYFYQEIFPKSLDYIQKALSTYQNLKDTLNIAKAFDHLGSLYKSREYCEKRTAD